MASKAVAKAAGGVVSISQKHTVQSVGIGERIRRAFAVDPNRSNGVPLNPTYRNPPPGAADPLSYDDPITLPAADIADNPYWERDWRRSYPRLSFVNQGDAVALLTVGSAKSPKQELVGEAGEKALVASRQESEQLGLASYLDKVGGAVSAKDLLVDGMPPLPSGQKLSGNGQWNVYNYEVNEDKEQTYGPGYPCRTFK